jgi:hypothetical protein
MTISIEDDAGIVRVLLGDISAAGDDSSFGLQVVSSDGTTVIIDGTSDMFKIAATGTLSTPAATGPGFSRAQVDLATGLTYNPMGIAYVGVSLSQPCLAMVWDSATGLISDTYELLDLQVVSGNQTRVRVQTTTSRTGAGFLDYTYRYYVLQETAV